MPGSRHARRLRPLMLSALVAWTAAAYQAPAEADQARGAAAPVPAAAPAAPSLTDSEQLRLEKGNETVMQVCTPCHVGLMRTIDAATKSREQWQDTVYNMIARGAHIRPAEIEPIIAYLASPERRRMQAASPPPTRGGRQAGPAAAPVQASLETEGKSILARRCEQCHDGARATNKAASEAWPAVLDRMVSLGAVLTPAERGRLVEYLDSLGRK